MIPQIYTSALYSKHDAASSRLQILMVQTHSISGMDSVQGNADVLDLTELGSLHYCTIRGFLHSLKFPCIHEFDQKKKRVKVWVCVQHAPIPTIAP